MTRAHERHRHPRTAADVWHAVARVREQAPLVHNITNYVVMNTTANALLAIGASPAMVHATDEVEAFVAIARALVVNIGTLSREWVTAMTLATKRADELGLPWTLDPVGAGATSYRTETAATLVRNRPAVIRGNASEILALAGASGVVTKGVDSTQGSEAALDAARALARDLDTVVAVTGRTDYITDGDRLAAVHNGHPLMTRVTGLGCTATALIGAFLAVTPDALAAATDALTVLGVAGELAAERAPGPGTLQVALLDALYTLDETTIAARARIA